MVNYVATYRSPAQNPKEMKGMLRDEHQEFPAENDAYAITFAIKGQRKSHPRVELIGLSKIVEVPLRRNSNGEVIPWENR